MYVSSTSFERFNMKVRSTNQSATEQRTTVKKRRKKLLNHLEGIINVGNLAQFNLHLQACQVVMIRFLVTI
jgi:hypothetical protein